MHKQRLIWLLLAVSLLCFAFTALPALAGTGTVYYYYQKICDSCNPQLEFQNEFFQLTGENLDNYHYQSYDVDTQMGTQALEEALTAFSVKEADIRYPVLIVGNQLYLGQDRILKDLPEYVLKNGAKTDSFFYYVSVTGCESCVNVEKMLKALPDTVSVKRGGIAFSSPVRVERVNLLKDNSMAVALFNAFHVEEGDRVAPILLAGNSYWQGEDDIRAFLKYSLPVGRAVNTLIVSLGTQASGLAKALLGFARGLCGCLLLLAAPLFLLAALQCGSKKAVAVSFIMAGATALFFIYAPGMFFLLNGPFPAFPAAFSAGCIAASTLLFGAVSRQVNFILKNRTNIQAPVFKYHAAGSAKPFCNV